MFSAVFLLFFKEGYGCSLALHNWKLVFHIKIPLAAPIFPLAEINAVQDKVPAEKVQQIIWLTEKTSLNQYFQAFLPFFSDWPARFPWSIGPGKEAIISLAQNLRNEGKTSLLIGSDQTVLQIALFSDANSGFNCHQLVIMQKGRIRAVFPDKASPWAQEVNSQAWLSLIFFQLPLPGRILSFSTYPISGFRSSIFEDHNYVENLLAAKNLRRRADLEIDPFTFDFPELPK